MLCMWACWAFWRATARFRARHHCSRSGGTSDTYYYLFKAPRLYLTLAINHHLARQRATLTERRPRPLDQPMNHAAA